MTNGSPAIAAWYRPITKGLKSLRFSFRPNDQDGLVFGFLFRLVVAIFAVVWSAVAISIGIWICHLLTASGSWQLSDGVLITYGTLISLTVLAGEHLRSRVYERVISEWPGDEEASIKDFRAVASGLEANPPIKRRRPKAGQLAAKRAFDLVASITLLVMLAPLLLIVSVLIKFDSPGPVLIWHKRIGLNRRTFYVAKFRTMFSSSEDTYAFRNDPRVTPVGRVLRRTSVDELPQLLNVVVGSMSLVGPRPLPVELNEFHSWAVQGANFDWVRPGLTGLSQVKILRGEGSVLDRMRRRLEFDRWYIEHWSMRLDIKILAMTMAQVHFGRST